MRSIDIWRDKVPSAACVFLISMLQRAMEVSGVHMANSRAERLPSQGYVCLPQHALAELLVAFRK